jgi:hypothetical protein
MKKFLLSFLVIGLMFIAKIQAQDCSEFFISEYVEGTSQSKAIEIYNPTAAAKSLSGYTLNRYSNGSATVTNTLDLTGIVAAYGVWVVTNGMTDTTSTYGWCNSVLYNMGNQHGSGVYGTDPLVFNGNDAVTIERTSDGAIIDIFARIGPPDPISGWYDQPGTNGDYTTSFDWQAWSVNHTLIRKASVKKGVSTNPSPFIVSTEYDSLSVNIWTNLGTHTCDCSGAGVASFTDDNNVYFFPNPVVNGKLTIKGSNVITKVELVNILGEKIFSRENTVNRADMTLDLGNQAEGVYFVKSYFADRSVITKKIIVK